MAISTSNPAFNFDPNWQPAEEAEETFFSVTNWSNTYQRTEHIKIEGLRMTYTVMRGNTARRYHTQRRNEKYYFNNQEISFASAKEMFDQAWEFLRKNNMLGGEAIVRMGLQTHRYYFDSNLNFIKAE